MAEQKADVNVQETLQKIMSAPVKIIGISGSLRKSSFNTGLLRVIEAAKIDGIEFEIVPMGDLPVFNQDLENMKDETQDPQTVQDFRAKIRAADAIFFASPEYNYGVSSPLKNALDWASRSANGSSLKGKCATIIGGGGGAGTTLAQFQFRQIAVFLELKLINKPEARIKVFEQEDGKPVVDFAKGDLLSEKWKERVVEQAKALRDFYRRDALGQAAFDLLSAQ